MYPPSPQRWVARATPLLAACLLSVPLASCGGGGGDDGSGGGAPTGGPAALVVSSVSPSSGPLQGGLLVTVAGSGFAASGTEVFFGGVPATEVLVLDDSTLTCRVPAGSDAVQVGVVVRNAAGSGSLDLAFEYAQLAGPDFNGDGLTDVAVGATRYGPSDAGAVYVFFGGSGSLSDVQGGEAGLRILGPSSGSRFGERMAAGDLDGDGVTDLAVSAPRQGTGGAVFVFLGPLVPGATVSASAASAILTAEVLSSGDFFGDSLAIGDLTGDGRDDLVVGAVHHDFPIFDTGAVYIFNGDADFTHRSASDADVKLTGSASANQFGNDLTIADVSGDGRADLLVGSPFGGGVRGELSVFFGGDSLVSGTSNQAQIQIVGETLSDLFGAAIAASDVNGDGVADMVVGAPGHDALGSGAGAAYVFFGGTSGAAAAADADAILLGSVAGDGFGLGLSAGDINGDGLAEVVVGARGADVGATNNGRVYTFFGGPFFGDGVANGANMIFTGLAVTNEQFGQVVELIDVDGDEQLDVCVGSFELGRGDVHVFLGATSMSDLLASQDAVTFTGEVGGDSFGVAVASTR